MKFTHAVLASCSIAINHLANHQTYAHNNLRRLTTDEEYKHGREFRKKGRKCSTPEPSQDVVNDSNRIAGEWRMAHQCDGLGGEKGSPHCKDAQGNRLLEQITPIAIPVKWHTIRRNNGDAQVTYQQIVDTMDVIKQAYAPDFEFVFDDKTDLNIVDNSMYYNVNWDTPNERVMKNDLRLGDCKTLNIYSGAVQGGLLGWATLPHDCEGEMWRDGVVINEKTLKGGSFPDLNLGHTLTHEVGHWMGLWHTFHNGCHGGDEVDDTPAQASPAFGCHVGRNSCPNQPGTDPIHNFMGYSDDICMTDDFTDDQLVRMHSQWEKHRDIPPPVVPQPVVCNKDEDMVDFYLELRTDAYGEETKWELIDLCGFQPTVIRSGGDYDGDAHEHFVECLPASRYKFIIYDEYEDGICCDCGNGFYNLIYDGIFYVQNGGYFEAEEITEFGECPPIPAFEIFSVDPPTPSPSVTPSVIPSVTPSGHSLSSSDEDTTSSPSEFASDTDGSPSEPPIIFVTDNPSESPSARATTIPSTPPTLLATSTPSTPPTLLATSTPSSSPTSYPSTPPTPEWVIGAQDNFDEGWGGFTPGNQNEVAKVAMSMVHTGGNGAGRFIGANQYREGDASLFIKGRKGMRSSVKTDPLDISSGYSRAEISFDFRVRGTRNNKRNEFRLEYCYDDCLNNHWVSSKRYTASVDFKDDENWKRDVHEIPIEEGHTKMRFRFRNLPVISIATVFIDNVEIRFHT